MMRGKLNYYKAGGVSEIRRRPFAVGAYVIVIVAPIHYFVETTFTD
jgi:hypothetical protein